MLVRMNSAQVVGETVHTLRTGAGISLATLAQACGVSKTTLHGIEQGRGNPTLSTLWALATALKVPLGELLEAPADVAEVVRAADERPRVDGDAVSARLLHRVKLRGTVEVYDIDVSRTRQESEPHLPGVEECLVLTRGRITAGPAGCPPELSEGDSIRFDGSRPHVYQGHTQRNRAVLLMFHSEG
jgi:transcriptional regulator with XRE-family HTH domain